MVSGLKYKNRTNPVSQQSGTSGWQIVYTGFILILLSFFIMLTSFASLQESKISRFRRAFSTAVSVFEGGDSLEEGETIINSGALIVDKEDQMAQLFNEINMLSQETGLDQVNLRQSNRGVIMTLSDKMLFNSGDATLSGPAFPLLDRIAQIVQRIKVPVEIEGHSDDRPIHTAAYASNWELSTARAVNVLRYLIEEKKVEAHRLSAVGFSSYHPAVKNNTKENRSQNRRVEIIFKPNESAKR